MPTRIAIFAGLLGTGLLAVFWEMFSVALGLNLEKYLEDTGADRILADRLAMIINHGWAPWIVLLIGFLFGVSIALFSESAIRKIIAWYKKDHKKIAAIIFRWGKNWQDGWTVLTSCNLESVYYIERGNLILFMSFTEPVKSGFINVETSDEGAKWTELLLTDRTAIIEIKGRLQNNTFVVEVDEKPPSPNARRQSAEIEYPALFNPKLADSLP
ncbi:MAG: hypothetical protein R3F54_21755 [Alphaproteobacteria bacterium]